MPAMPESKPAEPMSPIPAPTSTEPPKKNKSVLYVVVLLIVLIIAGALGAMGYFYYQQQQSNANDSMVLPQPTVSVAQPTQVACTLDAKICPDGSSVGRVAPSCEFAPCPEAMTQEASESSMTATGSGESMELPASSVSATPGI
jgi:hypothetical protein